MIALRPLLTHGLLAMALLTVPALGADAAPRRAAHPNALQERVKAAKNADAATQFALGLDFRSGNGVPRDSAQAYKWIHQAAIGNLAEAQFTVAEMELTGEGTPRKGSDAAEWFRKASRQGYLPAILALAHMLRHGEGVAVDPAGAANLYRAAADRNDVASQLILGALYLKGEGVTKNVNDAAVWFRRAAQLGSAEARYRLALLLLDGDPAGRFAHHPSKTSRDAVIWLQLAADQNYAPAQFALGLLTWGGITRRFDGNQAVALFLRAGDQGYVPALRKLAGLYRQGKIVAKDPGRALMYLELADQLSASSGGLVRESGRSGEREDLLRELPAAQAQAARRRAQEWLQIRNL